MRTERIRAEARGLEETLREQEQLMDRLYESICRKEHALVENNLDELKRAIESEEDLAPLLEEKDCRRRKAALLLAELLGLKEKAPSLREIAGAMEDRELADRLLDAGGSMSGSVSRLQRKNSAVREILTLKSEYTDTLLRLISGNAETEHYGYGVHGEMVESDRSDHGIYEVLI